MTEKVFYSEPYTRENKAKITAYAYEDADALKKYEPVKKAKGEEKKKEKTAENKAEAKPEKKEETKEEKNKQENKLNN